MSLCVRALKVARSTCRLETLIFHFVAFSLMFAALLLKVTLRWTSQMLQTDWEKGWAVVTDQ